MPQALALLVGAILGFVGSRRLRRPDRAAQAASVARTVGGSINRRRTLSPPELQRACLSEIVRHVRVGRHGQGRCPGHVVLHLHPSDLEVVEDNRTWFTAGLADALRRAAAENRWELDGAVRIELEGDPTRSPGVPRATPVTPVAPPAAASPTLVLVRTDTGTQVPLGDEVITIGRSRDRTITIDDERVSRSHATVERSGTGWTITDTGSANGTRVAGTALAPGTPRPLRPGDAIGVGPITIRVAELAGPAEGAGTALDDATRTRISRDVLPPEGRR